MAVWMRDQAISLTRWSRTSSLTGCGDERFGLPAAARSFSCRSSSGCTASWANSSASTTTVSETSFISPSTMTMASRVAATIMSISLSSRSAKVGKAMNWPLTRPMRMPANGPSQTRSERCSAAEAPVMASTSAAFSLSNDTTLAMSWVSMRQPLGNSGRDGRSIRRATRISDSAGRPSRRK